MAHMQNHSIEFYCIMNLRLLTQQLFNQIWPYSCSDALELYSKHYTFCPLALVVFHFHVVNHVPGGNIICICKF